MATYTNLLRLSKQATGENTSTWGQVLNDAVFELIEDSIAGVVTINTTGGTTALTENNGTSDQARMAVIRVTGSLGSNAIITVPDLITKRYLVRNDTTGVFTVTIKTLSGTGVTVPQGMATEVRSDGTNVVSDVNVAYLAGVAGAGYQPLDATLTALAGLTIAANSLIHGTGADAFSVVSYAANTFPARASTGDLAAKSITDFGLSLVDDANEAAARTTLGLVAGGAGDIWVEKAGDTMTGALGIVGGTASAPGLFFSGDANTGIYSVAGDTLQVATAGVQRIQVDSSGIVSFVAGDLRLVDSNKSIAAVTENLQLNSATVTGTIELRTAGATRLYVLSDGRVDIGGFWSTTAGVRLGAGYVQGLNSAGAASLLDVNPDGGNIRFDAGVLFVDATNNRVGINTSSPSYDLQVNGTAFTSGTTELAATSGSVNIGSSVSTADVNLNLGSGRSGSGNAFVDLVGDTTYTDYGTRLIRGSGGANTDSALTHRGTGQLQIHTQDAAPIAFWTTNAERGRFSSGGNLILGATTDNGYRLDVTGDTVLWGAVEMARTNGTVVIGRDVGSSEAALGIGQGRSASGYAYINFVGDTTYTDYGLRLIRENAGANTNSFLIHRGTGALVLQTIDAGPIVFNTSGSERGRILSGGDFLINTTTALNSFSEKLGVNGAITAGDAANSTSGQIILQGQYTAGALTTLGSEFSTGGAVLGYGVYPGTAATGTFRSATSIGAQRAAMTLNGDVVWYTSGAQTVAVGSAITLTERMTLTNAGALLVGGQTVPTVTSTSTFTNKTIALGSNTVSGTAAQFNTACTDDNFAFLGSASDFTVAPTINSTGIMLQGRHTVPYLAGSMISRTTNGASSGTTELATNKIMVKSFDFDQATEEYVQFYIPAPKSWNEGTVTARFHWTAASGTGDVIWGIQGLARSNDDALDTAFGTAVEVTDTLLTANDEHLSAESSAMTLAGTPAESDFLIFQVYRKAAAAGDTIAADVKLLAVDLFFVYNAGNDA